MPERIGRAGSPPEERLRRAARRWGGDALMEYRAAPPAYLWLFRSALVQASLDDRGAVELTAILLLGPERGRSPGALPPARKGHRLRIDHEGDILLERRLPPGIAADRLEGEVSRFCLEAHRLAEHLHARFGGQRAVDRFQDEVLGLLGLEPEPAGLPN